MKYIAVLAATCSLCLHAAPFTFLPGQGQFLYETDFTSSTGWDTSANSFVSHPTSLTFRPPAGGTIAAGSLSMGANGSAKLDLTNASILNGGLDVGTDRFALYSRVTLTAGSQSSLLMGIGNAEAFTGTPTPASVEVVSGFVRGNSGGSNLLSWGQKQDFNNPGDTGAPGGQQTNSYPGYVDDGTQFDVALLVNGSTVSLFTKETTFATWSSAGTDATVSYSFTGNNLVLYNPTNGSLTVTDFAISSIPEPGMVGLLGLGVGLMYWVRRRKR